MKTLTRNVLVASTVLACITLSSAFADGRDSTYGVNSHGSLYYEPGKYIAPYTKYSINSKWIDHGQGEWYSSFSNGESPNYNGYTMYDTTYDICRLACEYNNYCKGVEYRSSHSAGVPSTGWYKHGEDRTKGSQYVYSKCEIHYDTYSSCKKDPHKVYTDNKWDNTNYGKGEWDGCWEKNAKWDYAGAAASGVLTNTAPSVISNIVTTNAAVAFVQINNAPPAGSSD